MLCWLLVPWIALHVSHAQSAQRVLSPDGVVNDQFGVALAVSGQTLLVGANAQDAGGEDAGAVYFFEQVDQRWIFDQKIVLPESAPADGFGFAVDLDGNYAVVGALGDDEAAENAGAAYVYLRENDGWQFLQKLTADDAVANDAFGFSVALADPYLIVGARGADDNGNSSGAAYIFQRSGAQWIQRPKLTANDGTSGDFFGTAVAINNRFAVVGAELADGDVPGTGAAYVFENRGALWLHRVKLQASDGALLDQFGASVSLAGNMVLVGARAHDAGAVDAGAAYLFDEVADGFSEIAKLQAATPASNSFFGHAVALQEEEALFVLVGAPGSDVAGVEAGAAHVFEPLAGRWQSVAQLLPFDNAPGSEMGIAVAATNTHAFAGSWQDAVSGVESGSVFAFDLQPVLTSTESLPSDPSSAVLALGPPYPNPFVTDVVFSGVLGKNVLVEAKVFDVLGRQVAVPLRKQWLPAGTFEIRWDGRDGGGRLQSAGVYLLVVSTPDGRSVMRVTRTRR